MASSAVTAFGNLVNPVDGDRDHPTRGVPSTAAIGGHPIHPLLVGYPIAFLTGALATDVAARTTEDPFWARTSKWLIGAGIVTGLAAGAVGAIDYYTIRRAREKTVGKIHSIGNPLAMALAAANLLTRRGDGNAAPGDASLGLTVGTAALLGLTGWAGGEMSYRHMIGVIGENDQHDHQEKQIVH